MEHPDLFGPYPLWEWGDPWPGDEPEERSDEDERRRIDRADGIGRAGTSQRDCGGGE